MTDKYADLREALAAGPKPGKWTWKQVGSFNTPGCAIFWPDSSKGGIHYRRLDSGGGMEQVDADYIAAANPDIIRALLADYDNFARILDGLPQDSIDGGWTAAGASAHAKRLEDENARLRGLVAEMADNDTYETEYDGRMYSICHGCGAQDGEDHRRADCVYVRARAALAQEQS